MRVISRVGVYWFLAGVAVAGCDESRSRGGSQGIGPGGGKADDPVSFIEEDNYGPVAQYLKSNANFPVPGADGADGDGQADEGGDGQADGDGGGQADGGGDSCTGFQCNDGACIDATWKCDQIDDCAGAEDEANCPADGGGDGDADGGGDGGDGGDGGGESCSGFACNDGTCIDASWKCDQENDCAGGEDEANCPADGGDGGGGETCGGFTCNDGTCIDIDWVCDELVDCQGGEDEASCVSDGDGVSIDPTFIPQRDTQAVTASCLATWTVAGATTGSLAAKAATSGCVGGGLAVGFFSGGTGFAAAGVCFAGNASNADAIAGGVFGALSGLTGGLVFCEGGALDLATQAFSKLVETQSVPLYKVETKTKTCDPCAVPQGAPEPARVDCVPPSKPHHPCKSHHWHVYSWQVNQNPETCECHNNKREEVLCYDPVGDPDIASDPLWNVCL